MAEDRVRITIRTRWETGERFRLVLDAPRIDWDPAELIELGRSDALARSSELLEYISGAPVAERAESA